MGDHDDQRLRSQTAFAVQEGKRWREEKATELAALPSGTVVVFNVINGQYVTAANRIDALKQFHQRFGEGVTLAFSFEIDRPVFIGGGIA